MKLEIRRRSNINKTGYIYFTENEHYINVMVKFGKIKQTIFSIEKIPSYSGKRRIYSYFVHEDLNFDVDDNRNIKVINFKD